MALFTLTEDSTLRVFLPVIDSPQHLQHHTSLDLYSALPLGDSCAHLDAMPSVIFWLDTDTVSHVTKTILDKCSDQDDPQTRRIKDIKDEGWDLFLRIMNDGSAVVSAVAVSILGCLSLIHT